MDRDRQLAVRHLINGVGELLDVLGVEIACRIRSGHVPFGRGGALGANRQTCGGDRRQAQIADTTHRVAPPCFAACS
jgi:hypothetical protein